MDVGYATVVRERLAHGHDLKQSVRAAYSTEMRRKIKIVIEEAGRHPPAGCLSKKRGRGSAKWVRVHQSKAPLSTSGTSQPKTRWLRTVDTGRD